MVQQLPTSIKYLTNLVAICSRDKCEPVVLVVHTKTGSLISCSGARRVISQLLAIRVVLFDVGSWKENFLSAFYAF